MVLKRILLALLLSVTACTATAADKTYVFKFATLVPQGTTWMNIIEKWTAKVEKESAGKIKFKLYPGGVAGDEPDVIRKIRFGQLHGGAMTGHGIGYIYSPSRVLEIPFLFRSYDEVDHVRAQIMPEIKKGFHDNGFELLGWMEVGFIQFFSREPIYSLEDMRKRRIWLWQGDPLGTAFFSAGNISPVPLPVTEVFSSLSTGLIDTTVAPPLAAIGLQWFTKVSYMTNLSIMDAIGGILVSRKFFDELPKDLQEILRRTGEETAQQLLIQTRLDNEKSISVLKNHGITVTTTWKDKDADLFALRDRAAASLAKSGYIPDELYQRTKKSLEEYRVNKKK